MKLMSQHRRFLLRASTVQWPWQGPGEVTLWNMVTLLRACDALKVLHVCINTRTPLKPDSLTSSILFCCFCWVPQNTTFCFVWCWQFRSGWSDSHRKWGSDSLRHGRKYLNTRCLSKFAACLGRRTSSVLIISEHAKLTQCNLINEATFH